MPHPNILEGGYVADISQCLDHCIEFGGTVHHQETYRLCQNGQVSQGIYVGADDELFSAERVWAYPRGVAHFNPGHHLLRPGAYLVRANFEEHSDFERAHRNDPVKMLEAFGRH